VSGVLVPEHNHEQLTNALLNGAKSPDFLLRIAHAGAEIVRKNFDLSTQARRLEDVYLGMIGRDD